MKKCLIPLALLTLLCGVVLLAPSRGQAPARTPTPVPPPQPNDLYGVAQAVELPLDQYYPNYPMRITPAQSEIRKLVNQLRETDDEAKKADLTKQLEAAVAKHFDEDMKTRETELTKLEERLKKLRAQLDRRAKAKAELIQLQVKVLVNEAEGLGFSGASSFDPKVAYPQPLFVPTVPQAK
jgi:hypothetical protein